MSKYALPAIAAKRRGIAAKATLALEFRVKVSSLPVQKVAEINFPVTNSGVMETEAAGVATLAEEPSDLQCFVRGQLESLVNTVVTLNVIDADNGATTAVATFAPPSWVNDQSKDFPEGYAVDFVTGNNKKVKSIVGFASVVGGDTGSRLAIAMLPALESFRVVGSCTERDFTTKARSAEHIPGEEDGSKHVKRGRSEPGELTVSQKYVSYAEGLGRIAGRTCTAMLELEKEGKVTTDRLIFGNWVPMTKPSAGDGNDHGAMQAAGKYELFLAFFAP